MQTKQGRLGGAGVAALVLGLCGCATASRHLEVPTIDMSKQEVQQRVCGQLRAMGLACNRNDAPRYNHVWPNGIPVEEGYVLFVDIWLTQKAKTVAIEVKPTYCRMDAAGSGMGSANLSEIAVASSGGSYACAKYEPSERAKKLIDRVVAALVP